MEDTGTHDADGIGGSAPETHHADDLTDTAPQPVVTAEEAHSALAAHHDHVLHPHPHEGTASTHEPSEGHHVAAVPLIELDGQHAGPLRRNPLAVVAAAVVGVLAIGAVAAFALNRAADSPVVAAVTSSPTPGAVGLTPAASQAPDATSTTTSAMLPPSQPTLVLGDSLGLDVYPWLADALPDRYVSYAAEVGRSTPSTAKALDQLPSVPPVVIISSGTNDGAAAVVEQYARQMLDTLGAKRCVVWVDVARPDGIGDTQGALNAAIARAAAGRPNVRILKWSEMVAAHPEWMGGDGIHPNDAGAQARAEAMAAAAAACSPIDPAAPVAAQQYLPASIFRGPISTQYRPQTSTHTATRTHTPSSTATSSPTAAAHSSTAAPSNTQSSPTASTTKPTGSTPTTETTPASPAATPAATTPGP